MAGDDTNSTLPEVLAAVEQLRNRNGWPIRRLPASPEDWLIAILAYRLAESPHIQRAYGREGFDALRLLEPADIAVATRSRTLRELIETATSGKTISNEHARSILVRVGMPTPASLDIASVVAVAVDHLRSRRRALLADDLAKSTSTEHRRNLLERLGQLEATA